MRVVNSGSMWELELTDVLRLDVGYKRERGTKMAPEF